MPKTLQLRARAAADLAEAADYYRREAGSQVALAFIDAVKQAAARIKRTPRVVHPLGRP